jgi:hypothetical protein
VWRQSAGNIIFGKGAVMRFVYVSAASVTIAFLAVYGSMFRAIRGAKRI